MPPVFSAVQNTAPQAVAHTLADPIQRYMSRRSHSSAWLERGAPLVSGMIASKTDKGSTVISPAALCTSTEKNMLTLLLRSDDLACNLGAAKGITL